MYGSYFVTVILNVSRMKTDYELRTFSNSNLNFMSGDHFVGSLIFSRSLRGASRSLVSTSESPLLDFVHSEHCLSKISVTKVIKSSSCNQYKHVHWDMYTSNNYVLANICFQPDCFFFNWECTKYWYAKKKSSLYFLYK